MESSRLESRGLQREVSRTTAGGSTLNSSQKLLEPQQSIGQVRLEVFNEVLILLDRADIEFGSRDAVVETARSVVSGLDCLSELCITRWTYRLFDSREPPSQKTPNGKQVSSGKNDSSGKKNSSGKKFSSGKRVSSGRKIF